MLVGLARFDFTTATTRCSSAAGFGATRSTDRATFANTGPPRPRRYAGAPTRPFKCRTSTIAAPVSAAIAVSGVTARRAP